jgi:magnesium-transporting ATPase (P-type)
VAICQKLKEFGVEFQGIRKEVGYVKFFDQPRIFHMEMIFEFDSDRKKQSVVVREGSQYKLYVKGADSSILPSLKKNIDHPYKVVISDNLENFSLLGYRTLVFAMRNLSV